MTQAIFLNKDKTYTVGPEEFLNENTVKNIKYVMFDNTTETKANAFALVKAKDIEFDLSYSYEIEYTVYNDGDGTSFAFPLHIEADSLSNKYSLYPAISQLYEVYNILNMDFVTEVVYSNIAVLAYNRSGKLCGTYDTEDDSDLCDGLMFDESTSFEVINRLGFNNNVIVLYSNKTWARLPRDEIESSGDIHVTYIAVPSISSVLVTLLNIFEYHLLSMISEIRGLLYLEDRREPFLLGSCAYYSLEQILDFILLAPQSLKFCQITSSMVIHSYEIELYLNNEDSETATRPDISFSLTANDIDEGNVALLPLIINLLKSYLLEVI